jgi:hypothetical protein
MTFVTLCFKLISEARISARFAKHLTRDNYLICSDGLSSTSVPSNTSDWILKTHGLDPLCRLVIRVDQPLPDIWLKKAANIKLSITTAGDG